MEAFRKNRSTGQTTLPPGAQPNTAGLHSNLLALTVVWHPDLERIGATAVLANLEETGEAAISRTVPEFRKGVDEDSQGLGVRSLSRTHPSLRIVAVGPGHYRLQPGSATSEIEVDGATLSESDALAPGRLDRGVVILLNNEIVLCLHRAPIQSDGKMEGSTIVGCGHKIQLLREQIKRIAATDVPVLVQGETGTGKGLVAEAIAASSKRSKKPLISVDMASIPPSTASAELFGFQRGAFTGAQMSKPGFFGAAEGGTLFLDEIGCAPLEIQTALLRALGDGEIQPLGANKSKRIDVRIVAATDANLLGDVAAKRFSAALLQRLSAYRIEVPPLRERREDIGLLLLHFLKGMPGGIGHKPPEPTAPAPWLRARTVADLATGRWPGNVRGLRNAAQHMLIEYRDRKNVHMDQALQRFAGIGPDLSGMEDSTAPNVVRSNMQPKAQIPNKNWVISNEDLAALFERNGQNYSQTAAELGIPRTTVYEMVGRNPLIAKPDSVSDGELLMLLDTCGGDIVALAARLKLSAHGLKLRLAKLRRKQGEGG